MNRCACLLLVCGAVATASADELSLKDLKALEQQQSWREILQKADQVKPSARDASWNKLVAGAATHVIGELAGKATGVETARGLVAVVPDAEAKYPFLTTDKPYVAAKTQAVQRVVTTCREAGADCGTAIVALAAGIEHFPKGTALDIARMVSDEVSPADAMHFWRLAADEDAKVCGNGQLSQAVIAVLGSSAPTVGDAQHTATVCYSALDTALATALGDAADDSLFPKHACPVMKSHPGATVAKKKKCH